MRASAIVLGTVILVLAIITAFIWYAALTDDHRGTLAVTFLDVGQGDAILVIAPGGRRVLIDGGLDTSVLRELGLSMQFYTRTIDMVIATAQTPNKVGGLASVLQRYEVDLIVRSAALSSAPQAQAFTGVVAQAQQNGSRLVIAQRGDVVQLGGGAFIEIFSPDRDASLTDASDGCLAFKLVFGSTSFFFACGSSASEAYLATLDGAKLQSNVLLATGDDPELFLGLVSPQFAVIPCNAQASSSSIYSKLDIQTLSVCGANTTFLSNGQTVAHE